MVADILQDDQKPVEEPQIKEAAAVASDLLTRNKGRCRKTVWNDEEGVGKETKRGSRPTWLGNLKSCLLDASSRYWNSRSDEGAFDGRDRAAPVLGGKREARSSFNASIPKSCWLGFYDLETESKVPSRKSRRDWRFWRRWTRRSIQPEPETPQPQLTIR
jgi:hypothetical protein